MGQAIDDRNPSPEDRTAILLWLAAFEAAVRARDFAAGRRLCTDHIFGFGSVAPRAEGIDQLESNQWQCVWPQTEGFAFDHSSLHCGGVTGSYWVAALWSSRGQLDSPAPAKRSGRATIILHRSGGQLLAVHTHFSLVPPADIKFSGGLPS
jgi:ketosteroid isomerase-like protein